MGSEDVGGYLSEEKLEEILEEIVVYEVMLEIDPTLPQHGYAYLQRVLAECRKYLNRVTHYLQITRRYEKNLRKKVRDFELDLELKMSDKLADDELVRRQPAAQDRRALAMSMLKAEYEHMAEIQVELLNLEETVKIIKSKHDSLKRTNGDIRLQRQMVKDDRMAWEHGDEGYTKPQVRADGVVPGGLPPPVSGDEATAEDLLEGAPEAEALPDARDRDNVKSISDFYEQKPSNGADDGPPDGPTDAPEEEAVPVNAMSYEELLS